MRYIGLDLSTRSTGYSVFTGCRLDEYGAIVPPESMNVMDRIYYIADRVRNVLNKHNPDMVVIEDVFYDSNYLTTKILNRLAGSVVFMIKDDTGLVTVDFVMPTEARKCFGLLPKSNKKNVVDAVNGKFGLHLQSTEHDVADAVVIGYSGYYKDHNPTALYSKTEKEFYTTRVRGLKTPKLKGTKNVKRKISKE